MPDVAAAAFGFGTPFEAQIAYLRAKLALPTERWGEIEAAAHDRAFTVAGAAKADLVADLQAVMVQRATDGQGLQAFRRDFKAIVAKHGWTGWTGEGSAEGEAWRTRVIYQTNMATAYAAGRRQQLLEPGYVRLRPYWRYIHSDTVMHPREQHLAWHGLTLAHDHPFWIAHFPPNGFGCQCRVVAVSAREGEASARAGLGEPPEGWDELDPKTGAPVGIGKGFGHAPGAAADWPLQRFIDDKLLALDAPIGAAMWRELAPVLQAERAAAFSNWVDGVVAGGVSRNEWRVAAVMQQPEIDFLAQKVGQPAVTAEIAVEDRLIVGRKAERHAIAGDALTVEEWKSLPGALADAKVYFDRANGAVLYVTESLTDDRSVKLAVAVNFVRSRPKQTLNLARAAYKINAQALEDRTRYQEIR
ncbi:MAG: hypothetical protein JSR53_10250 [Proteobacteria bacterium]|nr:hypothetical protein [Pseudomonadota bacterium]